MALPPPPLVMEPERRPSPALTIELSSNNPFRNLAPNSAPPFSPALDSPLSIHSTPGNRPVSRNPFLSAFEQENTKTVGSSSAVSPTLVDMDPSKGPATATRKESFTDELLKELSIGDKETRPEDRTSKPPPYSRGEHGGRRPSHPQEGGPHARRPRPRGPPGPPGPPGERRTESPRKSETRRPRRNSDSSVVSKNDDERRRRERREREKASGRSEGREGEKGKEGDKPRESRSHRSRRKGYLDVIDKMDATGLYGTGLFHHDGPYDSLNPHRNRKKDYRAPMQAFPANSANNAIGGSGPVNKNIDVDKFNGITPQGFTDYNATREGEPKKPGLDRQMSFDPKSKVEQLHGEESLGLGTSTFLEGAPASNKDIQRQKEVEQQTGPPALSRTKSLAQRFQGIRAPPRRVGDGQKIMSPEGRYPRGEVSSPGGHTPGPPQTQSAGGLGKSTEQNPFFDDYNEAYDKKGAAIKIAEEDKIGRPRAPSIPAAQLERRNTADSVEQREPSKSSAGFMSRVKSLKGGKRRAEPPS